MYDYIAVDIITKDDLQIQHDEGRFSVEYTPQGLEKLIAEIRQFSHPLIVFTTNGGYEHFLIQVLRENDVDMHIVHPPHVSSYLRTVKQQTKTPDLETDHLLAFAKNEQLTRKTPPSENTLKLSAFFSRKYYLMGEVKLEQRRLQNNVTYVHSFIKDGIQFYQKSIQTLDKRIDELVESDPVLKRDFECITSSQEAGRELALCVLAYLYDIPNITRNEAVALAGLTPTPAEKEKRFFSKRRMHIRQIFHEAAETAAIDNPLIKNYVDGLMARGKVYEIAIAAAMRKLLIRIRAILLKNRADHCCPP